MKEIITTASNSDLAHSMEVDLGKDLFLTSIFNVWHHPVGLLAARQDGEKVEVMLRMNTHTGANMERAYGSAKINPHSLDGLTDAYQRAAWDMVRHIAEPLQEAFGVELSDWQVTRDIGVKDIENAIAAAGYLVTRIL